MSTSTISKSSKEELSNKLRKAEKLSYLYDNVVKSIKALADAISIPADASAKELETSSELLQQAAEFRDIAVSLRTEANRYRNCLEEFEASENLEQIY